MWTNVMKTVVKTSEDHLPSTYRLRMICPGSGINIISVSTEATPVLIWIVNLHCQEAYFQESDLNKLCFSKGPLLEVETKGMKPSETKLHECQRMQPTVCTGSRCFATQVHLRGACADIFGMFTRWKRQKGGSPDCYYYYCY